MTGTWTRGLLLVLVGCVASRAQPGDSPDEPLAADAQASTPSEPVKPSEGQGEPTDKSGKKATRTKPVFYGFVQTHYKYSRDTSGDEIVDAPDFRVQRVRLGVKGDVFPWLSYEIEVDPRSPEVAGVLRDAFVSFKFIPNQQLRVGQQKTQFGYENRESSSNLYAVNRTELSDTLSRGVNLRDVGLGLLGHLRLSERWRLEDAVTFVNGAGFNVQADNTRKKNVWGRLGLRYKNTPGDLTFKVGVSGATGDQINEGALPLDPVDDFVQDFRRLGADFQIDHRYFFLSAEYVRGRDEDPETGEGDEPHGYYVNLVGKTRFEVGPIVRYETLNDDFRRWTFGAYYGLPARRLRVLFNYEYRKLRDGERADDKIYLWLQVRL